MPSDFEVDERTIIDRLQRAGWQLTQQGKSLKTASLEYSNGTMTLAVEQEYGERELTFTMEDGSGANQNLFISYGTELEKLLDEMVQFQDDISPHNFHDKVRNLLAVCPEIYIQEDEDSEPRRLSPE